MKRIAIRVVPVVALLAAGIAWMSPQVAGQSGQLSTKTGDWPRYTGNVTGDKYMIIYGSLGKGPDAEPLTPAEPGYVTQRFPANQGQFQVRYVGRNVEMQSLTGDTVDASYLGTSRTYNIANGKIVTELVGTPIEITVYKVGDKYVGARSNEFGYANYALIPAVEELSPLR